MIGKLLGHSQPQTTARYAHLADDPMTQLNADISGAIAAALLPKPKAADAGLTVPAARNYGRCCGMTTAEKITALKSLAAVLAQRGVTGLSVFGSQVTGHARPDSDIDVIVDYDPDSHFSLLDLVAVGRLIEERIGIKADVMTRPGLHPILKDEIESNAIRVY